MSRTSKYPTPGRPPLPVRPDTTNVHIRHVHKDAMSALHIYAYQHNITVGDALSEIVLKVCRLPITMKVKESKPYEGNHVAVSNGLASSLLTLPAFQELNKNRQ